MKFNIDDLPQETLFSYSKKTIDSIYGSYKARKGRTWEQIARTVTPGLAPEVYLIEEQNFTENTHKYGDVIRPDGVPVEVKTTTKTYGLDNHMRELRTNILNYCPSELMYLFTKNGGNYKLYKIMDMRTGEFIGL